MDSAQKFTNQIRTQLFVTLLFGGAAFVGLWWLVEEKMSLSAQSAGLILAVGAIGLAALIAYIFTEMLAGSISAIWQAILHVSPDATNIPAPDTAKIRIGRELVTMLIDHVYQIASVAQEVEKTAESQKHNLSSEFVANSLPIPIAVVDKNANIAFANDAMAKYLILPQEEIQGKNAFTTLDLSFSDEDTLSTWLDKVRDKSLVETHTWERVRLVVGEEKQVRLFNLVAYYNQNNPDGYEIILALFDQTRQYSQDEQAMSFVALAVHELRAPLTLLRGYIDAFEEELEGKLDPELTEFMHKMEAASQQLATFMTNVLNVSRFENDELVLKLHEEKWEPLLQSAVDDMQLRANVRGMKLTLDIQPDMPTVGVDSVSIYEVITNLIDNAIKYSQPDNDIIIKSHLTSDGLIETTVQDFGAGIPENATNNLFEKFYRDYRNRQQVGGTGMGLFICKAIVKAHGGSIWVNSKEGEGSTFGFTLLPYSQLTKEIPQEQQSSDIVRTAHGWIKNHSMYRR